MNTIRVSNSLDQDQAKQNVGPDLGPVCLRRFAKINFFEKFFQENHLSVKQIGSRSGRAKFRPDTLSGLVWLQTVCEGYQQKAQVAASKERVLL